MTHISEESMLAFQGYISKEAASLSPLIAKLTQRPVRHAMQQGVGTGMGLGLMSGAAIGAGTAGKGAYDDAREMGATKGRALLSGLGAGLGGAVRGAGKGALVGAATGGALGALRPGATAGAAKALSASPGPLGASARFGQRQVHGFVGGSARALERARGGAYPARQALESAVAKNDPKAILQNKKWLSSAEKAQDMGLTSLPGVAKAIPEHGLGKVVGTGLSEQWHSMSPSMKALMVGFPALSVAGAAAGQEMPSGPGKGERIGKALGTLGYGAMPLGIGASMALGTGLERAGGLVGRGVDKLRGRTQQPEPGPAPEPMPSYYDPYGTIGYV